MRLKTQRARAPLKQKPSDVSQPKNAYITTMKDATTATFSKGFLTHPRNNIIAIVAPRTNDGKLIFSLNNQPNKNRAGATIIIASPA